MLEVLQVEEARDVIREAYPRVLATLMLRAASSVDNKPPRQPPPQPHDPFPANNHQKDVSFRLFYTIFGTLCSKIEGKSDMICFHMTL